MQHISELAFSLLTIALAILAIVVYIYQRASSAFYATVAMAIVIGFINAWLISRTNAAVPAQAAEQKPRATRRRRGAAGR